VPEEYFESAHFKLPALTGKNPIRDIGTGFQKLVEKTDEVLWGGATGIGVGAWTALSGLNAKLNEEPGVTGVQTLRIRAEQGAAAGRLRGGVECRSPEEVSLGETLFTLPVGLRPPGTCQLPCILNTSGTFTVPKMQVTSAGVCTLAAAIKSNAVLLFDGITFNLT
jgi:hypothetical protein